MQWLTQGAAHTFVSAKLVKQYGLSVSKCPSYIKSVNAKAQAIVGRVYNVPIAVGNWVGKVNMMIIQLEDFQLILGIKDYTYASLRWSNGDAGVKSLLCSLSAPLWEGSE